MIAFAYILAGFVHVCVDLLSDQDALDQFRCECPLPLPVGVLLLCLCGVVAGLLWPLWVAGKALEWLQK